MGEALGERGIEMYDQKSVLDLGKLPKVDLHRHLEGAIRPATALELGQAAGILPATMTLAEFEQRAVISEPVSLFEALDRFDLFRDPVRGYHALLRIVDEAVEDAAVDRVTHLNLRFSPYTLATSSGLSMREVFQAVSEGLDRALPKHPLMQVEPMVVISRRHGLDAAWSVLRELQAGAAEKLAGVDLASDELRHRTAEFVEVARAAVALGLPLTVHTGEGTGPDAVAETLALPGLRRLGHAVSLIEDGELVRQVVDLGLTVEVCPTSNLRSMTVASLADHPAPRLLEAGVRISFCTDDPSLFGLDLSHELRVAHDELGLSEDDVLLSQQWGREAFFGCRSSAGSSG